MELIGKSDAPVINAEAIAKGDLIRAKYSAWSEERNGQVAAVTQDEIRVIWQPYIRNVTNFFTITAEEIKDGLWTVKWTPDMETIYMYPAPEEPGEGDGGAGE